MDIVFGNRSWGSFYRSTSNPCGRILDLSRSHDGSYRNVSQQNRNPPGTFYRVSPIMVEAPALCVLNSVPPTRKAYNINMAEPLNLILWNHVCFPFLLTFFLILELGGSFSPAVPKTTR